jgi:hypothetical protein
MIMLRDRTFGDVGVVTIETLISQTMAIAVQGYLKPFNCSL